jgi:hypothetical protein
MSCSTPHRELFQEAIDHCRWKTALQRVLPVIRTRVLANTYCNKTFEEVFTSVYSLTKDVKGVGILTTYDISAAIMRYHKKDIDRVYIVGGGPQRAVKLLGLRTKMHILSKDIRLKYITIQDTLAAFDAKGYTLPEALRSTQNGDSLESHICNWQKTV